MVEDSLLLIVVATTGTSAAVTAADFEDIPDTTAIGITVANSVAKPVDKHLMAVAGITTETSVELH